MGLPKHIRETITDKLMENFSDFEKVLQLDCKDSIFREILIALTSRYKKKLSGFLYPSDVYRAIRRYKHQLKTDFDESVTEKVRKSEVLSVRSVVSTFRVSDQSKTELSDRDENKKSCQTYRGKDDNVGALASETTFGSYGIEQNVTIRDEAVALNTTTDEPQDEKLLKAATTFSYVRYLGCENVSFAERHSFLKQNLFTVGIYCVMIFKGCHERKRGRFSSVEYAFCKHSGCRKFKISYEIHSNILSKIEIRFDKEEIVHDFEEHSYQLRGHERVEVKRRLLLALPNTVRSEDIRDADAAALRNGNWDKIRSLGVYQKARSEAKAAMDLDQDSYIDLILRSITEPDEQRYVQVPDGETLVYIYTRRQIEVVYSFGERVVAYFDATGSVVRPVKSGSTAYYYALTVNVGGNIFPVAELISSKHDSTTISCFFMHLKRFITIAVRKSWPPFLVIVTDWSFALISGVCFGLNEMTLYRYLKIVYAYTTNQSQDISGIIILRTCCSHFIKMVANKLAKIKTNKQSRKIIIEMVSSLVVVESFELLSHLFRSLMIVLLHPHDGQEVEDALILFKNYRSSQNLNIDLEEFECNNDIDKSCDTERGKYSDSPFYLHYFKILNDVVDDIGTPEMAECGPNQLKSVEFAHYFLNQCMPFVPLWSGILSTAIGKEGVRFSNANVECWFKIIKKDVLGNERRLKVGRFVEKTKERIEIILKSIEFDIGLKPRNKKTRNLPVESENLKMQLDRPLDVEKWKAPKEKITYFSTNKIAKRLEKYAPKKVASSFLKRKKTIKNNPYCSGLPDIIKYSDFEELFVKHKLAEYVKQQACFETYPVPSEPHRSKEPSFPARDEERRDSGKESRSVYSYLENGLLFSSHYYLLCSEAVKPKSFLIGSYEYDGHRLRLPSGSYATLRSRYNYDLLKEPNTQGKWLTDDCIDAVAYSILRHHPDLFYINAVASSLIFNRQCDLFKSFQPVEKSLTYSGFILMPVNFEQMHWYLLVFDLKFKEVYVLNSSDSLSHSLEKIRNVIKYFFELRNKSVSSTAFVVEDWKLKLMDFAPQQNDSVNCGVYVLYYIYALTETKNISKLEEFFKKKLL